MNEDNKYLDIARSPKRVSIPFLALGIVSVAAIARALYNSRYGEHKLSAKASESDADQSKSLSYMVADLDQQ